MDDDDADLFDAIERAQAALLDAAALADATGYGATAGDLAAMAAHIEDNHLTDSIVTVTHAMPNTLQ